MRKAGQMQKIAEKKYLIRVYLGRDANGRRRYFNKTIHATAKQAQDFLNRKLAERDLGTAVGPNVALLGDWIHYWLTTIVKVRIRQVTLDQYHFIAENYILPMLGDTRLCDLKRATIEEWVQGLVTKGLKPRTVRLAASVLHNALDALVARDELPANPCKGVALPKKERAEVASLTVEQARVLLDGIKVTPYEALWALLLLTGMRPAEALALRWRDVHNGVVAITRSLSWTSEGPVISQPKTAAGRRSIPLPEYVLDTLADRKVKATHASPDDLIFATGTGTPLEWRVIKRRHFKPLLKRLGLPDIRGYDLRHTCTTLMIEAGVSPATITERLGHRSTAFLLDTYSHVLPHHQVEATRSLGVLLEGPATHTATPPVPASEGSIDT